MGGHFGDYGTGFYPEDFEDEDDLSKLKHIEVKPYYGPPYYSEFVQDDLDIYNNKGKRLGNPPQVLHPFAAAPVEEDKDVTIVFKEESRWKCAIAGGAMTMVIPDGEQPNLLNRWFQWLFLGFKWQKPDNK